MLVGDRLTCINNHHKMKYFEYDIDIIIGNVYCVSAIYDSLFMVEGPHDIFSIDKIDIFFINMNKLRKKKLERLSDE